MLYLNSNIGSVENPKNKKESLYGKKPKEKRKKRA